MKKIIVYYKGAACVTVSNEEFAAICSASDSKTIVDIERRIAAGASENDFITATSWIDVTHPELGENRF